MKFSLRELFLFVSLACLAGTVIYQYTLINQLVAANRERETELLSIRAVASHHGVDIPDPRSDAP